MKPTKSSLKSLALAATLILLSMTSIVYAQANSETHRAGMKRIAFLDGKWGGISYERGGDGAFRIKETVRSDDPDPTKTTTFKSIYNGNYYQVSGKVSYNFSMTIGYDQWRDTYVMVGLEDGPGLIDIYQGNFQTNGDLVLSNFSAGTHYVHDGAKHYNRMVFSNISETGFTWFIDDSTDGTNWSRIMRYDLKK